MRWCVLIGAVLVAGAIAVSDVAGIAAQYQQNQIGRRPDRERSQLPSTSNWLLPSTSPIRWIMDELAIQRDGYAQAIVSDEFLQALKTGRTARSR